MQLSFENLRAANARRGAQWDGKPAALDDLSFRAMELGGETGEALNFCKKLVRELTGRVGGMPMNQARPKIAEELADVVICADRVAEVLDIDLPTAITEKFNATSLKHGLVMMQECMPDADLDALILAETKKENERLRSALLRVTGSLGLIINGAGASGTGHKENYDHARAVLEPEPHDADWTGSGRPIR